MRPPTRRRLSVCLRPKPITRYFLILSVPLFALALALVHGFAAAPAPKAPAASVPNGASAATANGSGFARVSGVPALNAAAGIAASLAAPLAPSAFNSGDLVVYRVGDGSAALSGNATAVFLDEYTTGGTLVQSIALPTAVAGSNKRLTASGTATTEGYMTRSTDGRYLILAGYDANVGTSVASSNSSSVNRVIGRVDASGTVDTTTALADNISPGNARGAASTNGTDMWMTTSASGIRYATFGGTTSTQLSSSPTNTRATNVFNNQLYITSASGAFQGVAAVGTGTPTTTGQTTTALPGFPTATGPSPHTFVFFNSSTVYVADDRATGSGGGLQKWTLSGGTWSLSKTFNSGLTAGLRGVTLSVNGSGQPVLWATTADTASKLVTVTDTGSALDSFTTIATAGTNKAFRGVALAPSGATPTNFNLTVSSAGTGTGNVTNSPLGTSCGTNCSNYGSGTSVTLTATADGGSTFTGWTGCDSTSGNTCTVAMNANRSVTATFTSTLRTLTVSRAGTGTGTVTSSPAGINCGATCSATYADGTPVTLTAAAGANSIFAGWSGCDSTSGNTCNVTMGAARAVTATFNTTQRVLSVSRAGTGTGTVTSSPAGINCGATCSAIYADGTPVTLTATPDANMTFAGWSGACTGTGNCAVTMDASKSVTATFSFVAPSVKISQVYGGGGNSGSTYTNDFVELYNSGSTAVVLDGWSVQETSATSTSWTTNGPPTVLSGTIQPGHYYLVQESQGTGGTTPLPTPNATGTITIGAANGKVALVAGTAPLTGSCPLGGTVVDFVGYGTADCAEANAAAPALSVSVAAVRRGNGCQDTDNNANDFVAVGPIPRNGASPANSCGGDATQPSGLGIASPSALDPASNTLLTVKVTPATAAPSTGITVNADLTSIGGSATQQFYDDGTNGDATAGDNTFSFQATVAPSATTGVKSIVATITDEQARIATAPITLTVQSPTCGIERWSVKVGTDPDVSLVNLNNPVHTTIGQLRGLTPPPDPPGPPDNARIQPDETTVYEVDATMTLYKKETDVDYHIVLQDDSGQTMVAEIPSPACVLTPGSPRQLVSGPFSGGITSAREKFDARFTADTFFKTANVPVRVKGVAFFDFIHGQTGVAPNGIELHPILDIEFTANTTTTLVSSSNPSQYGQQVSITATVTNGGAAATPTGNVTFFDGGSAIDVEALDQNGQATFTSHTLSVGSHTITASYEGDDASAPSSTPAAAALAQVVNKADQTIDFAPLAGKTYGDPDFALSATASSGLPVSFQIFSGPATVSGNTVHITGAGTVTVRASQPGDGNYNAAPDSDRSFVVAKADQTINFAALADKTYGDAPFTVSATGGDSGNAVTFSASGNCASAGANGATITITGAGQCTVTASQAGGDNYNAAADVARTFTINQAAAVITVNGYTGTYDGNAHGATGTATGLNGEDLSGLLDLGSSFTNVPGGTAHWSFAGNNNYAAAGGTASIVINKATPTLTWNNPADITYGTPLGAAQLNATASVPGGFVYGPAAGTVLDAGGGQTLSVSFSPTDSTNYTTAGKSVLINVLKATPSFSDLSSPVITYGTASTTLSGKLGFGSLAPTGSVAVTLNGVTQNAAIQAGGGFSSSFATASLPPSNPPYIIAYSYGGDSNFNPASGAGTLTVGYSFVALYDQTAVHNGGSTIPIKLAVTDAAGNNISSAGTAVTAVGLGLVSTTVYGPVEDAGNANPDENFRFTGDGYIFNLKTTGLASGVYNLYFRIGSDPTLHTVQFQVK